MSLSFGLGNRGFEKPGLVFLLPVKSPEDACPRRGRGRCPTSLRWSSGATTVVSDTQRLLTGPKTSGEGPDRGPVRPVSGPGVSSGLRDRTHVGPRGPVGPPTGTPIRGRRAATGPAGAGRTGCGPRVGGPVSGRRPS